MLIRLALDTRSEDGIDLVYPGAGMQGPDNPVGGGVDTMQVLEAICGDVHSTYSTGIALSC